MTRFEHLENLKNDSWYKRLFAKLKKDDLDYLVAFVKEHDHLNHNDFTVATNRFCMKSDKPKKWSMLEEIAAVSNDRFHRDSLLKDQ